MLRYKTNPNIIVEKIGIKNNKLAPKINASEIVKAFGAVPIDHVNYFTAKSTYCKTYNKEK